MCPPIPDETSQALCRCDASVDPILARSYSKLVSRIQMQRLSLECSQLPECFFPVERVQSLFHRTRSFATKRLTRIRYGSFRTAKHSSMWVSIGRAGSGSVRILTGLGGGETVATPINSHCTTGHRSKCAQPKNLSRRRRFMHALAKLCVNRPVFATMLILSFVVGGSSPTSVWA